MEKIYLRLKRVVNYSILPVGEPDGEKTPGSVIAL